MKNTNEQGLAGNVGCGITERKRGLRGRGASPFAALAVLVAAGCSAEVVQTAEPNVDSGARDTGHRAALVPKILNGLEGGTSGVVALQIYNGESNGGIGVAYFTGQLISDHFMLTAGHCINPAIWADLGGGILGGVMTVTYTHVSTETTYCLTRTGGTPFGACDSLDYADYGWFLTVVHPEYTGGFHHPENDTADDIALVFLDLGWPTLASQRIRLALSSTRNGVTSDAIRQGDDFFVAGGGTSSADAVAAFANTLRYDPDLAVVDWVGDYFVNYASDVIMCVGDSGGPALMFDGAVPISFGVASNVEQEGWCAAHGSEQRWARVDRHAQALMDFMNTYGAGCQWRNLHPSYLDGNALVSTVECTN